MLFSSVKANERQLRLYEQVLYDHLLERVKIDSPETLLEDFERRFVMGRNYSVVEVYSALEKIAKNKLADETFDYFLNRCCHILINRWQMEPRQHHAIPELVGLTTTVGTVEVTVLSAS